MIFVRFKKLKLLVINTKFYFNYQFIILILKSYISFVLRICSPSTRFALWGSRNIDKLLLLLFYELMHNILLKRVDKF